VVTGVSFAVRPGDVLGLVGESGSGKTTVALALLGHTRRGLSVTSGEIRLDGTDLLRLKPAELRRLRGATVSYVPQDPAAALNPALRIGYQLREVLRVHPGAGGDPEARILEVMREARLDAAPDLLRRYPHQLSGGQQQRVGVARALAAEPAVLLMDEPFGALDPIIRAKAQEDLLDIQRRFGTTIVLVTHDMDEAFLLGDRVAVMSQGRVLQYDRPTALLTRPTDPFVSRMTGLADRAMRLLSLTTAGEVAAPGGSSGPQVPAAASLRDALSEILWSGADSALVVDADGTPRGHLTLAAILAHGRPP
jgi:osmoprotectant transport system ATP-binding protein